MKRIHSHKWLLTATDPSDPTSTTMPNRAHYDDDLAEFFQRKRSVEVAFNILVGGASFSELEDSIDISTSTLSRRLKAGEHHDLWTTVASRHRTGGRSKQKYVPTTKGTRLLELMADVGVPRIAVIHDPEDKEYQETVIRFIEVVEDRITDGELKPPWEEAAEPTAEAHESIGEIRARDIEHRETGKSKEKATESDIADAKPPVSPVEFQNLLKTVLENQSGDVSWDDVYENLNDGDA